MKRSFLSIWIPALVIAAAGAAHGQAGGAEEMVPGVSSPAPAGDVVPAPAAPVPNEYVVQAGDTLSAIAERVTGDRENWVALARANGIEDPGKLQVGMRLKIPADLSST